MNNLECEVGKRVEWIQKVLENAHSCGIVVGNSGGKDSATVIALSKRATDNVIGVIMPSFSLNSD
jgi:NAD+ synthase